MNRKEKIKRLSLLEQSIYNMERIYKSLLKEIAAEGDVKAPDENCKYCIHHMKGDVCSFQYSEETPFCCLPVDEQLEIIGDDE